MTKYAAKVKECSTIVNAIGDLKADESIDLMYGELKVKVTAYMHSDKRMWHTIWNCGRGMNISKIGKTTIAAYTYDMMTQKTTYTFNIDKMSTI
jgi:hypothetical protein|tara:strand:+ start:260 stop:541 length:282 start_codon:yes stop_codon:yes gene_type:complete